MLQLHIIKLHVDVTSWHIIRKLKIQVLRTYKILKVWFIIVKIKNIMRERKMEIMFLYTLISLHLGRHKISRNVVTKCWDFNSVTTGSIQWPRVPGSVESFQCSDDLYQDCPMRAAMGECGGAGLHGDHQMYRQLFKIISSMIYMKILNSVLGEIIVKYFWNVPQSSSHAVSLQELLQGRQ